MNIILDKAVFSCWFASAKLGGGSPIPRKLASMTVLYVAATEEEAAHLPETEDLLVTGIGTVAAAVALTRYLATHLGVTAVVNFGTAGLLNDNLQPVIYQVDSVIKHDFDAATLRAITGKEIGNELSISTRVRDLPVAHLATGDSFIGSTAAREALALQADLVDMEGYAIAAVCAEFQIPCVLIKQVSDTADESAAATWAGAVAHGAKELAEAALRAGEHLVG